jgi:hypothetical protein
MAVRGNFFSGVIFMNLADQLRSLEEQLLNPIIRHNPDVVAKLLCDDFREFGSSGRSYSKAEIIESLRVEAASTPGLRLSLIDFLLMPLSGTLALVTYRSRRELPGRSAAQARRSSLWTLRNGRWQILFHQGTSIPLS